MKHSLPIQLTEYEIFKFWAKVNVRGEDQCWPWLGTFAGGPNAAGIHYGVMRLKYTGRKHIRANRISAFIAYGESPSPFHFALHTCDNPNCCNPAHIYWGLPESNSEDLVEDNTVLTASGRAHQRHIRGKLKPDQVRAIRMDKRSASKTASAYGVTKQEILRIRNRKTWKWVD